MQLTYQLNFCFPAVFDRKREGCLEAGRGVGDGEVRLVWAFRGPAFLGSQDDLERIGSTKLDCFR